MAALVVAALAQCGDRTGWLAAILADRYRPAVVIVAAALALAANYALAAAAGTVAAPILSPDAKLLLLACALLIAAGGMPFAPGRPDPLTGWRIGGFPTAGLGLFVMAFGDATQFVAAALAARSPVPWLAGVGATIGSLVVVAPAALLGEAGYRRLPLAGMRWGSASVLLLAGLVLGLHALGLT
ncbi:TMEM165/GDT1 family protein [Sphingomonas bacterium]|uniref:TMEM165/GDT1 family protein n=1 Tax=Sphingomonas bacterium TaxID=1895847 RepID=UPI0020C6E018|nr:TMEM165/GDT1 family protein [Sphingomonas bacterium]